MSTSIRTRIDNLKDEIDELEKQDIVTPIMVSTWVGSDIDRQGLIDLLTECVNELPHMKRSVQEYWEDQLEGVIK
jgi:hypothetical protein